MENTAKVRIRMYRQGLGDCFLLTFFIGTERQEVHMLIDCGSIGKGAKGFEMEKVIRDIHATTSGHIHILVVTHEHEDHVSGFNVNGATVLENGETKKLFEELFPKGENKKVGIDNVWLAWTEEVTHAWMKEKLDILTKKDVKAGGKKRSDLEDWRDALMLSVQMLTQAQAGTEKQALDGIDGLLGLAAFEGSPLPARKSTLEVRSFAYTIDEAMDTATTIARDQTFLKPGQTIEDQNLIPGWRFYILGPPQDQDRLKKLKDDQQLYHFSKGQISDMIAVLRFFLSGKSLKEFRRTEFTDTEERQEFDAGFPFDDRFRMEVEGPHESGIASQHGSTYRRYFKGPPWRRIDYDWLLGPVESMALQLDNYTNNTSLVLAMEHVEDGRVLLFPGDAQLGNWQTWDGSLQSAPEDAGGIADADKPVYPVKFKMDDGRVVTSTDLLSKTVFYKVGHHSSHNATTIAGLKKMTVKWKENNPDQRGLVVMIPLDSETAANKGKDGWNMPAPGLYEALLIEHKAHVLRSDTGLPRDDEDKKAPDQQPSKWYGKNFKKDDPVWEKLREAIKSYRDDMLASASIEDRSVGTCEKVDGTLEPETPKSLVFSKKDQDGKLEFHIEYEVDPRTKFDPDTKRPKEIPEPCGKYIDYIMY